MLTEPHQHGLHFETDRRGFVQHFVLRIEVSLVVTQSIDLDDYCTALVVDLGDCAQHGAPNYCVQVIAKVFGTSDFGAKADPQIWICSPIGLLVSRFESR